ncbi:MAG: inositol monophosphatase [bacterium]|nr:inositol monophosphatase [bacterium]
MNENQFLEAALAAVKKAEPIFLKYFGNAEGVSVKEGIVPSLVSDADKEIEKLLMAELHEKFPEHAIVGEESPAQAGTGGYCWYIDPIDGTTNFTRGISHAAISVALFDEQGPLVAVLSAPQNNTLYHAVRGGGAFKNGEKLAVSNSDSFNMLVGGMGWKGAEKGADLFKKLLTVTRTLRVFGSDATALALVAEGSLDCFATTYTSLYDVGAGMLLVSEAGGKVTGWNGEPFTKSEQPLVASNGKIHDSLLKILA